MKRIKRIFWIIVVLAIVLYLLGPKPEKPELSKDLPSVSAGVGNMTNYIKKYDAGLSLKPDNETRMFWANETKKQRTEYCVLYLHGFSASWYEGYPTHVNFAKKFGCNLYIPRLAAHGIEGENALLDMFPDRLWKAAKEALMVARSLGKKVIIMGTSTGGTLALKLAADFPEYVDGLILYSPNIRINNKEAFLLSKPWGLQIARKSNGGKYRISSDDFASKDCQYWYCKYRMEAVVYLQQLVEATMDKETFKNVTAPTFVGYYYKNENNQDNVVKVGAIKKMYKQLGTLADNKMEVAFPEAGNHVIACELTSRSVEKVFSETVRFASDVMDLTPID